MKNNYRGFYRYVLWVAQTSSDTILGSFFANMEIHHILREGRSSHTLYNVITHVTVIDSWQLIYEARKLLKYYMVMTT
jgi:hypothetical protein